VIMATEKKELKTLDTAIKKVSEHECMDVFDDVVKRFTIFDWLLEHKAFKPTQVNRVIKHREDLQERTTENIPAIIGLLLQAMQDLSEEERRVFTAEHLDVANDFMVEVEKLRKKTKRDKKKGPFSHVIVD